MRVWSRTPRSRISVPRSTSSWIVEIRRLRRRRCTMADSARLDAVRLGAELFFIHRALSRANERTNLLSDLESEPGSPSALIWRSLYSDCLRAVRSVANADGVIYDLELDW